MTTRKYYNTRNRPVYGSSWTVNNYNNNLHHDPQAFVGWKVLTPAPQTVDQIQEQQEGLAVLFNEWQLVKGRPYSP
jgi:hypothetical protein